MQREPLFFPILKRQKHCSNSGWKFKADIQRTKNPALNVSIARFVSFSPNLCSTFQNWQYAQNRQTLPAKGNGFPADIYFRHCTEANTEILNYNPASCWCSWFHFETKCCGSLFMVLAIYLDLPVCFVSEEMYSLFAHFCPYIYGTCHPLCTTCNS